MNFNNKLVTRELLDYILDYIQNVVDIEELFEVLHTVVDDSAVSPYIFGCWLNLLVIQAFKHVLEEATSLGLEEST